MRQTDQSRRFRRNTGSKLPTAEASMDFAKVPVAAVSSDPAAPFVRLEATVVPGGSAVVRLDVPSLGSEPLRTHQPNLETLTTPPPSSEITPEDEWEKPSGKAPFAIPAGWIILTTVIFASALTWGLLRWVKSSEEVNRVDLKAKALVESQNVEREQATKMVDSIDSAVRNYFRARTVDELSPLVRHSLRVTPLMREYYSNHQVFIGTVSSLRNLTPLNIDPQSSFWVVPAILSNGHRPLVTVEVTPDGKALIDWESLVCHQSMDWTEYAIKRPEGTTMSFRVYAEPVNFYSHEFKDPKEWLCVRLTAYESTEFLFGYAKIHSEVGETIRELIKKNQLCKTTMTLRLSLPPATLSPRGVVIDEVLFPGWICPNHFESAPPHQDSPLHHSD